ncbi:MAG: ferritin family protein [Myxococcota bacterium]|jgi:rubrerythrin|nr:ferritin family protein [Myxococcota bacterium]
MTSPNSVSDIFKMAIQEEEEAYSFYTKVAASMKNAAVKEIFLGLAKDELGHKEFLRGCASDATLLQKVAVPDDFKVAEATPLPALSTDMKPVAALMLAMKKEQRAAEGYRALSGAAKDPAYRQMFQKLADMELGHKAALESAFVNIGYPEVF